MNTINERIKYLSRVYTGGLMNKFAQKIDISTSTLGDIVGKKQNSPSFDQRKVDVANRQVIDYISQDKEIIPK